MSSTNIKNPKDSAVKKSCLWEIVLPVGLSILLYYFAFAWRFLKQNIVLGGDTQGLWSFHYLAIRSLTEFGEFLWWDPTSYNGWPAYFYWISGFVNYLNPLSLPPLGAAIVGSWFGLSTNTYLILQKTVYAHALNVTAITLISRELIRHRLAILLPPVIFTLSEISFHGFRDAVLYESLPPSLFYLFGLLYLNNRRTQRGLMVFCLTTGVFLSSLNYAFLQSSFYWTTTFTVLLILFYPDLPTIAWQLTRQMLQTSRGRRVILCAAIFWASAFAAFFLPVYLNLGHVIRVSGSAPVQYDLSLAGDFGAPGYSIMSYQLWNVVLAWAPIPDIHDLLFKFDPWGAAIDHRYLGLATLPLLTVALFRGYGNSYVWVLFISSVFCGMFLIYTVDNPYFMWLIEHSGVFKNIRTMANTMPREGPSIFVMLLAGIGLDLLINRQASGATLVRKMRRSTDRMLLIFLVVMLLSGFLFLLLAGVPQVRPLQHALGYVGIFLALFSVLCVLLLLVPVPRLKRPITIGFLIVVIIDLSISAGAYWRRGLVWFENSGVHRYPTPDRIAPIADQAENWPGSYRGIVHNLWGGPWYGVKEWLVLAHRPSWQPVLRNWDPGTRMMREYPSFAFYSGGQFVPFAAIRDIDHVSVPERRYVAEISTNGKLIEDIDGKRFPIEKGLAGFIESVEIVGKREVIFHGWAVDEKSHRPARKMMVFVGDRLWTATGGPFSDRADVERLDQGYRRSGFLFSAFDVPPEQRVGVRVFAILADGTARELSYSDKYPFSPRGSPTDNPLPGLAPIRMHRTSPYTYLHEKPAIAGLDQPGIRLDIKHELLHFTPNTVRVAVDAPREMIMVSHDNYDRFWKATIDGAPSEVYRANFTYKAVRISAGRHIVEWRFDPWPVKWLWIWFYMAFAMYLLASWRARRIEVAGPAAR